MDFLTLRYTEYPPSPALAKYIKCYYTLVCWPQTRVEDNAYATGCIEVMFTLSGAPWQTKLKETFSAAPHIELWGQMLQPLAFRTAGESEIFGIRFFPSAATLLLREEIHLFNGGVFDLSNMLGNAINELHGRLQDAPFIQTRIELVETYLMKKLTSRGKTLARIDLVQRVMDELTRHGFSDNIDRVAARFGLSSRYLQKVFLQCTGLTPKLYSQIHRFQNSLVMLQKGDQPLTAIAYECGYFDQSHFIREFKSFTGLPPSRFDTENSSILASPLK